MLVLRVVHKFGQLDHHQHHQFTSATIPWVMVCQHSHCCRGWCTLIRIPHTQSQVRHAHCFPHVCMCVFPWHPRQAVLRRCLHVLPNSEFCTLFNTTGLCQMIYQVTQQYTSRIVLPILFAFLHMGLLALILFNILFNSSCKRDGLRLSAQKYFIL